MRDTGIRKRRSTAEVRALIVKAAYEEFAAQGLDGASIRSIASRAGVTESMVFRHFVSKGELFQQTAAGPLVRYMYDFGANIVTKPGQTPEEVTLEFVSGLYDICRANSRILASLLSGNAYAGGAGEKESTPVFEECLEALVRGVRRYIDVNRAEADVDIRESVRMVLTLVLGATMGGSDLFPPPFDDDEVKSMLSRFVLFGAGYNPGV